MGSCFSRSVQHVSIRDLVAKFAATLEINTPEIRQMTTAQLADIGFTEALEMLYLFKKPFQVDTADTERLLEVGASSLEAMIQDTLRAPA